MRAIDHNKLLRSLRVSNLVGTGMPERIRAIGFAFLGLTAAAGLALVAIFAQMGFPLLSPAPLPKGPAEPNSVSRAVAVEEGPATAGLAQSRGLAALPSASGDRGDSRPVAGANGGTRGDGPVDRDAGTVSGNGADATQPAASPPPATSPAPSPAPTAPPATTTEATSAPAEVPVSVPETGTKPDKSTAVGPDPGNGKPAPAKPPKPIAKPAKSKPVRPKGKTIQPEPKPVKSEAAPAPAPVYVPAPAPAPEGKDKLQVTEGREGKDK